MSGQLQECRGNRQAAAIWPLQSPDRRRRVSASAAAPGRGPMAQGRIYVGIGGWTFEPWRGVFYPEGLTQKRELEFASRALTSIEIHGPYYSTFKPASWQKWHDETPAGFVFSVNDSRYCTNRPDLAPAGAPLSPFPGPGHPPLG